MCDCRIGFKKANGIFSGHLIKVAQRQAFKFLPVIVPLALHPGHVPVAALKHFAFDPICLFKHRPFVLFLIFLLVTGRP